MVLIPRSFAVIIVPQLLPINRVSAILVTQRSQVLALSEIIFFVSPVLVLKSLELVVFIQILVRIKPAF